MSQSLKFDDRVVVVTGAGNGLGRSHALLFASRGAKVLVNDLGGDAHGGGKGKKAADKVVAEIKEAGGEAAANYDSVTEGHRIIESALDHFGRVDVVVNNAGILRDSSFHKMSEEDWDLIYQVHVLGGFKVTHAAWPHLREQQYGRVVFTASAAGLYGNFGQANYSMAKLGLVGLAKTLAVEGKKRNIFVNAIAPLAGSRLTETIMPPELVEQLKPEYVSPLVVKLCHEDSDVTGGIFEVGAGWISSLRWERTQGHGFKLSQPLTPEAIDSKWSSITDYKEATNPDEVNAALAPAMNNLSSLESKGGNEFIDVDEALGFEWKNLENSYDERDLSIYALGVGAATDPVGDELKYVYELHGEGFKALPTYGVVPALKVVMSQGQAPGLSFGLDRILHGEQYLELKRPLPRKATLTHNAKLTEIWDKGKNALVVTEINTTDETGEELMVNRVTTLVRGAGGWGGERGPKNDIPAPDRKPDKVLEEKIADNQALLYRLTGDWNPLHADPSMAVAFGYEKPILHGLCTFGYVGRQVIQEFAGGNPDLFKSIAVRFSGHVFPGETLVTHIWKENDTRYIVEAKVKERDKTVISNCAVELYTEVPKKAASKPKADTQTATDGVTSGSAAIFAAIGDYVASNPDLVGKVNAVFQFTLTDPDSAWILDLKNGEGEVKQGVTETADCGLKISEADFIAMATGKANPQELYFGKKLAITGNIMLSQKLSFLQKIQPSANDRSPAATTASAAGSAAIFEQIAQYVKAHPELTKEVNAVFQFTFTDPDSTWVLDLKKGIVTAGTTDTSDCGLTMTESDFVAMATGKANPQELYFAKKMAISGNIMLSQKLSFLQKLKDEAPAQSSIAEELLGKVPTLGETVQFRLLEPDSAWYVEKGKAKKGTAKKAAATFEISEADLALLLDGKEKPGSLFQRGRLKVTGNMNLAHGLQKKGAN